jgi:hypothetical protein
VDATTGAGRTRRGRSSPELVTYIKEQLSLTHSLTHSHYSKVGVTTHESSVIALTKPIQQCDQPVLWKCSPISDMAGISRKSNLFLFGTAAKRFLYSSFLSLFFCLYGRLRSYATKRSITTRERLGASSCTFFLRERTPPARGENWPKWVSKISLQSFPAADYADSLFAATGEYD